MRLLAAVFVLAAALSASTILRDIAPHDEGLMLQAARRIADGQLPYRDFWWNYGPGQPLLLAPFADALLPWRILRVLLDATIATLGSGLAMRHLAAARAHRANGAHDQGWRGVRMQDLTPGVVGVAVAGAMAFPTGPGPNPAALALGLGALLLAPRRWALAGVLAGLAAVFRLEIGGAAALGLLLLGAPRGTLVAMGVAALGWLPFLAAAPGETLDQTLGFLAMQDLQRLPFPLDAGDAGADPNKLLERFLPLVLVLGLAAWAVHAAVRRPPPGALALAPLALAGLAYLLGRTDEFHLVPLAVALPVGLAVAAAGEPRRWVAGLLLVPVALIALHGLGRKAGQLLHPPALAAVPGPAGDGVRADAREVAGLRGVLRAVEGRTLFVAPPRFDQVTVGHPLLYVLAGAQNPTRYDVLQPGVVTTAAVQRELRDDLERARPEVLVRWRDPRTAPEDNPSGRSSGVRLLDAYLERAYGPARRIGDFDLHERVGG